MKSQFVFAGSIEWQI